MSSPTNDHTNNMHDPDQDDHEDDELLNVPSPSVSVSSSIPSSRIEREEEMLRHLGNALVTDAVLEEVLVDVVDEAGDMNNSSIMAETLLLDADDEDFDAHSSPYFSSVRSWGSRLLSSLQDEEVHAYDETMLQLQMEQASNDSIDSGAYEFREHDCDLMGIPNNNNNNRVVDEEAYQRHLRNAP